MIKLNVTCGCKFTTTSLQDAVGHAEETGHILALSGSIQSDASPTLVKTFNRQKATLTTSRLHDVLMADVAAGRFTLGEDLTAPISVRRRF